MRLLHRILHRLREVFVGDLQIMFAGDLFAVADPRTHNVRGEQFLKFRLASATEILEQLRPHLQAGPLDDSQQLRSQVGVRVAVMDHRLISAKTTHSKTLGQDL